MNRQGVCQPSRHETFVVVVDDIADVVVLHRRDLRRDPADELVPDARPADPGNDDKSQAGQAAEHAPNDRAGTARDE